MTSLEDVRHAFPDGTFVKKKSGYDWPGVVCGVVPHSRGILVVVENRMSPGTVHVFTPSVIEKDGRSRDDILGDAEALFLE